MFAIDMARLTVSISSSKEPIHTLFKTRAYNSYIHWHLNIAFPTTLAVIGTSGVAFGTFYVTFQAISSCCFVLMRITP